jgi:hypothetical protein
MWTKPLYFWNASGSSDALFPAGGFRLWKRFRRTFYFRDVFHGVITWTIIYFDEDRPQE